MLRLAAGVKQCSTMIPPHSRSMHEQGFPPPPHLAWMIAVYLCFKIRIFVDDRASLLAKFVSDKASCFTTYTIGLTNQN